MVKLFSEKTRQSHCLQTSTTIAQVYLKTFITKISPNASLMYYEPTNEGYS